MKIIIYIVFGWYSLFANVNGVNNSAFGHRSLQNNTTKNHKS